MKERSTRQWPDLGWWMVLAAVLAALLLMNPNGFTGGGLDDLQYLNAARCWREHGPCLPLDHWQGRWPVIAPIALFTGIFGESRFTVSIAPFVASVAAVYLLALIVNRVFGRPVGWIAALLFLSIPAFTFQLTQPMAEAVELTFLFGGFLMILQWESARKGCWALGAGLLLSLAFQVRETAAIGLAFAFVYAMTRKPAPKPGDIFWAGIGFALPVVIELIIFLISTGDPLWRRGLSIAHTQIPSTELLTRVDRTSLPFFNTDLIANWRMHPGIRIHWTIDGITNLLVNAFAGLSLLAVPAIAAFPNSGIPQHARRNALRLWLIALLYIAILIYVLAIDPKPRMMLVAFAMTTTALALLTWGLYETGRAAIAVSIWFAAAVLLLPMHVARQRIQMVEGPAADWIREHAGLVEIDSNTRRYLALVPAAKELPGVDSDRNHLLYMSLVECRRWLVSGSVPSGTFEIIERAPVSVLAEVDPQLSAELCLLRYKRHVPATKIQQQIRWRRP